MDKNTITGFILLALLTVGYVFYTSKEQEKIKKFHAAQEQVKSQSKRDSSLSHQIDTTQHLDSTVSKITKPAPVQNLGSFSNLLKGSSQTIKIENEDAVYTFDTKGGVLRSVQLKKFKTYDKSPLILFDAQDNQSDFSFLTNENKIVHTKDLYFKTSSTNQSISEGQTATVNFELDFGNGGKYIHTYKINGEGYLVDFNIKTENANQFISPTSSTLDINWTQQMPSLESNLKEERMYSSVYYRDDLKHVYDLSVSKNDSKKVSESVQWVSFKQKFFNSTIIAKNTFFSTGTQISVTKDSKQKDVVKEASAKLEIPFDKGGNINQEFQWYLGPNKYSTLRKLKIGLDEVIPMGWAIFGWVNKFMIIPVFNLLSKFISNYGIIIFILTLLLKLVLTPLTRKQLVSSAKMKILKPEIDELKKKYPNDKQMVGTKQMEIFRNAGVNPMGGCLPMLLQMPILFAMYRFFPNSIELRQQPFLWATDLSHYDSIYHLPFTIPIYGDHVSLFTLLMAITSIAYSKVTMSQQQSMSMGSGNDMMATQMKLMPYLTPIMFLFMFNSFSAALSYYYFLFNLLSLIQTYAIQKFFIDENALKAEIEFNKKQPKKKSAWQERMEQMMEQQKAAKENKKK